MAAPEVKPVFGKEGIFGPSSADLKKAQDEAAMKAVSDQSTANDREKALGPGFGGLGYLVGSRLPGAYVAPEIKKASSIEEGVQHVDDTFEPDPAKSDLENEATKLGAYYQSVGHLLSPDQKLQLTAQKFAYLNDAFQQSRLKSADERDNEKLQNELKVSRLQMKIDQQKLIDARNAAQFGDQKDEAVFALPDGGEVSAPVGSDQWRAYQKADLPYKGTRSELLQQDLKNQQRDLQDKKTAMSAYTAKERQTFRDLASTSSTLAQILNMDDPSNPDGRFFDNAAGWKGYLDAAKEKLNDFVGSDVFSSATQAGNQLLNKYRVDLQQLIKGIPSDKDQAIVDATRMVRGDNPAKNRARMALAINDITYRARIAYAEARERLGAGEEQYIPAGIVATLRQLGVDPKDVDDADAEYQAWNDNIYSAAVQMQKEGAASPSKLGKQGGAGAVQLDAGSPVTLD